MKKRVFINLLMALLVAGLFLTVSCAQQAAKPSDGSTQTDTDQAAAKQAAKDAQVTKDAQGKTIPTGDPAIDFANVDIYFEFDSADLTAEAQAILQIKAAYLKANNFTAVVEGHCDERGTTEYNLALGERRANAAKNYVVDLGVSEARLSIVSYGEEQPMNMGHNNAAWTLNRRGHFELK